MALDPRTPVLVGVGASVQREEDAAVANEAFALMVDALEAAADDAGTRALLERADVIAVPKGIWAYSDPGRLVAERVGAATARTALADVGILQQTPLTRAAQDIAAGRADVVLVTGGEAKYRSVRAQLAGRAAPETVQLDGRPDERLEPAGEIITRLEIERGLAVPAHQYAVMESALRHDEGVTTDEHARSLAALWSSFSRVAARNPDAWSPDEVGPDELGPSPANRMVALPYTKLLCSQWNVDQAAGLIMCSVEAAERHHVPRDRWVFPIAAAESNTMIPLSRRAELHRSPAVAIGGARLFELAGAALDDVAHLDLYSCFPAAVRIQARELGLEPREGRDLTVTGGMTFAGGPLNNYVLQATVTMARVLRADPGALGLVTSVSGMLTKHGLGLWSTAPPEYEFRATDVSDEVRNRTAQVDVLDSYEGRAEIAGYTVTFDGARPVRAVAISTLPGGAHTIVTTEAPDVAAELSTGEWCGRTVFVGRGGRLDLEP